MTTKYLRRSFWIIVASLGPVACGPIKPEVVDPNHGRDAGAAIDTLRGSSDAGGPATVDVANEARRGENTGGASGTTTAMGTDGGAGGTGGSPGTATMPTSSPVEPQDAGTSLSTCTMGSSRCADGGKQECVMTADGSWTWSAPTTCPSPQTCPAGGTQCECPKAGACTKEGAETCNDGATAISTCVREGACLVLQDRACPAPMTCKASGNGTAACGCPASCKEGARKCGKKGGVETCQADASGCTVWAPEKECQKPRKCNGGEDGNAGCSCPAFECSQGDCATVAWSFEGTASTADIVVDDKSVVRAMAIRNAPSGGGKALAVDVTFTGNRRNVVLRFPVCARGGANLSGKRLSARVSYTGAYSGFALYGSIGSDRGGAGLEEGTTKKIELDLGTLEPDHLNEFRSANTVLVQLREATGDGPEWRGTFWIDDLKVE